MNLNGVGRTYPDTGTATVAKCIVHDRRGRPADTRVHGDRCLRTSVAATVAQDIVLGQAGRIYPGPVKPGNLCIFVAQGFRLATLDTASAKRTFPLGKIHHRETCFRNPDDVLRASRLTFITPGT